MYLYGASGHAKVIIDILTANHITIDALVDDNPELQELHGIPVVHSAEGLSPFIVSIGSNNIRKKIAERIGGLFATAIHPSAIISPYARIGEGSVVMQGAIIQSDERIVYVCSLWGKTGQSNDCCCRKY